MIPEPIERIIGGGTARPPAPRFFGAAASGRQWDLGYLANTFYQQALARYLESLHPMKCCGGPTASQDEAIEANKWPRRAYMLHGMKLRYFIG